MADELARQGSASPFVGPEPALPITISKKRLRLLVGTVSGHFTCNNHLFNIGLSTIRICNRCETDAEIMYHLVSLCSTLAKRRFCILGDYVLNLKEVQQVSLMKIVDFLTPLFLETCSPSI